MHRIAQFASVSIIAAVAFAAGRAGLNAGTSAVAQPEIPDDVMEAMMTAMAPGEHHTVLEQLVGTWEGWVRFRMEPGQPWSENMPGTVKREMVLGGRFVKEIVSSPEGPAGPFEGIGYVGYNNLEKRFESVWMENAQTAMFDGHGYYDPDAKKMTFMHEQRNFMTGAMEIAIGEMDISNPDRHVYKGWMIGADGKKFENFEGVFERVAGGADVTR